MNRRRIRFWLRLTHPITILYLFLLEELIWLAYIVYDYHPLTGHFW